MDEAFEELSNDLENDNLRVKSYKVRMSKPMSKEEFTKIRKELEFTQAQIAEVLDLSIKSIQAYEQGRIEPSGLVAKVMRLMHSNKSYKNIFCGENDKKESSTNVELIFALSSMLEKTFEVPNINWRGSPLHIINPAMLPKNMNIENINQYEVSI
jgi:DNA-binding transcriptional regulator YiaG